MRRQTRREALRIAVGAAGAFALMRPAHATPDSMKEAIRSAIGDVTVTRGKVKLDIAPLVENANSVTMGVSVESPMTEADFVKRIHVFNEKNPLPDIVGVTLGPRSGRAAFSTRIRLADTQFITAIAEMSDGTFWSDAVEVVVTLAACVEN